MIKGGLATSVLGKMYTSAFLSEFRTSFSFFFFFFLANMELLLFFSKFCFYSSILVL
jgi:hypothetical protein